MRDIGRLRIFGRVDLDGTHRAIVETNLPDLSEHDQEATQDPTLRLSSEDRVCGCILSEISSSDENRVFVDRYKLWHLGLNDGDQVGAELFTPTVARRVDIRVSVEFGTRDAVRFIGKPLVAGEKTALFTFSGEPRVFTIKSTEPKDIITITPTTEIVLADTEAESAPITYKDIGGLDYEVNLLRELVEYPLKFGEVFTHLGVTPPKGIILYGPPGTGKTLLARALANQVGARFYTISGPEIYSKWYGKSEQNLRNIFDDLKRNSEDSDEWRSENGTGQSATEERKIVMDCSSKYNEIWLGTAGTSTWYSIDQATEIHQKLGQLLATAKRRQAK